MKILHITTEDAWEVAEDAGELTTPSLEDEGFIHMSTYEQVDATANRIFTGSGDLLLLEVETDALTSELKWEQATDVGADSPPVYAPLTADAVVGPIDLPMNADGGYVFNNERSSG